MDDFLNKKTNSDKDKEVDENKKIELKFFKEKRTSRTYIYNMENYITEPEKLADIMKNIKKSLGTACTYKKTEFGKGYGFNGDLRTRIAKELIDTGMIKNEDFKNNYLN